MENSNFTITVSTQNDLIVFDADISDDYFASVRPDFDFDIENGHRFVCNPTDNLLFGYATTSYYSDDAFYFESTSDIATYFGQPIADFIASELANRNLPTENFIDNN